MEIKLPIINSLNETRKLAFIRPLSGKIISSFGIKSNGLKNEGINIESPLGTSIQAIENGLVSYVGNGIKGLGNVIILRHTKDYMTVYAHVQKIFVSHGDVVKQTDIIATVGKTGKVKSPQLHLEIRKNMKAINPTKIIKF